DIRGFVDNSGRFDLPLGFETSFELRLVTDDAFLQEFDYSDDDRLTSFLNIDRYRDNEFAEFRIAGFQSLRDDEPAGDIPVVLPSIRYRKTWDAGPFGGRFGVTGDVLSLVRTEGRDVLRAGGGADWRGSLTFGPGLQLEAVGDLRLDGYRISDDVDFEEDLVARAVPTGAVTLRWPFALSGQLGTHVVEPIAQLVYSDALQSGDIPNEDSLLPELDETSLFALNRFPGEDAQETGARLNLGVNYTLYSPDGWSLGFTGGQVFRQEEGDRFSVGSGLTGVTSDFVAAVSFDLPPALEVNASALFAPDSLTFRRGRFDIRYSTPRLDVATGYVFLAADPQDQTFSELPERQEYTLDARYRFAPNWELSTGLRYDLAEMRATEREAEITYGNECVELALSVSRRLATSSNVPTSTNFGFRINLTGLGSTGSAKWPAQRCAS
ncbi:MAG: LPS-assembly protein LptD, partial [Pseudomonadota bacterium]